MDSLMARLLAEARGREEASLKEEKKEVKEKEVKEGKEGIIRRKKAELDENKDKPETNMGDDLMKKEEEVKVVVNGGGLAGAETRGFNISI